MSLNAHARPAAASPAVSRSSPVDVRGATASRPAPSAGQLERELVALPNKALRQAACDLVAHAGAADHESTSSLYRLLYTLERLQVTLAWCDALRAATLLELLPEGEGARHRERQRSLAHGLRGCATRLEELCRATPGPVAPRLEQLRSRLVEMAATLLDRLFCEERLLYPHLVAEAALPSLRERAMRAIDQLDERGPLGRAVVLEYLLRGARGAELARTGSLLLR